ncbi:MAG: flavodoxin [Clostridiales Family XIII bacterium]|jgi:flavodoxin short chain|nr:flavodoxin [Clostridiales Family XIII bacterium]
MKINIIYWSGTGNTEAMAELIQEGAGQAGAEAAAKNVSAASDADLECDVLCLGCPSMGAEVLEEDEFEPYIASIEGKVAGKTLALFGSYGWGDGEWMRDWTDRMKAAGATLKAESLIVNETPEGAAADECKTFGALIAKE